MIGEQFNNMMHILETKNLELGEANKQLAGAQHKIIQQEKMACIGQLAAGVAHEINNPMGYIASNLSMLDKYSERFVEFISLQSRALQGDVPRQEVLEKESESKIEYIAGDVKDLISESLEGAARIKQIVQDLKGFSRTDDAEYKPASINDCIESTINIVWNELKYKATLNREFGDIAPVMCYPRQLNQVFMNLLVNAAQAIEKQGEITVRTWNGGDLVNISVSDTGCGIPQEKLNRIFEPLFTTKDVNKGTGLGLSIAYEIVKKHEGEITVESEPDKGTTFRVTIPARRPEDER
jgi:two-component system NtrC family sensor kinase